MSALSLQKIAVIGGLLVAYVVFSQLNLFMMSNEPVQVDQALPNPPVTVREIRGLEPSEISPDWIMRLQSRERDLFTMNGEDGIIEHLFEHIGITNKYCVELGLESMNHSFSQRLVQQFGWSCISLSPQWQDSSKSHHQSELTVANVNLLLMKFGVPRSPDFLSIYTKFEDYWLWKALTYSPRLLAISYNPHIPPDLWRVVPNTNVDAISRSGAETYYGASLRALAALGHSKGYCLVGTNSKATTAFFIEKVTLQTLMKKQKFRMPTLFQAFTGNLSTRADATHKWLRQDVPYDPTFCLIQRKQQATRIDTTNT